AAAIDAGFDWNTHALDEVPEWTPQRYADYIAAVDTQEKAQGLGGVNRVNYSAGATRQLIHSYKQQYSCRVDPAPDPYAEAPVITGVPVDQREQVAVTECEWRVLGPFVAADRVKVTSTGDGDVDLYVQRGTPPEPFAYDCRSAGGDSKESCETAGGGLVYVAVFGAKASTAEV